MERSSLEPVERTLGDPFQITGTFATLKVVEPEEVSEKLAEEEDAAEGPPALTESEEDWGKDQVMIHPN